MYKIQLWIEIIGCLSCSITSSPNGIFPFSSCTPNRPSAYEKRASSEGSNKSAGTSILSIIKLTFLDAPPSQTHKFNEIAPAEATDDEDGEREL